MIIKEEKIKWGDSEIILRCARTDEAETVLEGYKKLLSETKFLALDSDEMKFTVEQERAFIENKNADKYSVLILAFVDGRYAGNCGFDGRTSTRRTFHRASMGIAIFQEFAGRGLGKIMLEKLIDTAKCAGLEQMELRVFSENIRAQRLYKKLGFEQCGAIPYAVKFPDGTSFDEIMMYKKL